MREEMYNDNDIICNGDGGDNSGGELSKVRSN